jgi:hypothetical protein
MAFKSGRALPSPAHLGCSREGPSPAPVETSQLMAGGEGEGPGGGRRVKALRFHEELAGRDSGSPSPVWERVAAQQPGEGGTVQDGARSSLPLVGRARVGV